MYGIKIIFKEDDYMSKRKKGNNTRAVNLTTGGKIPVLYAIAIVFSCLYVFGHINQLQGTIIRPGSGYLNITNLLLCILGVLEAAFPILIVMGKDRFLKIDLYAIASLYIVGNLWFIRWIYVFIFSKNGSFDFAAYQLAWYNMFNHTIWASRNAETLLLNYLSSFLWFRLAYNIDKDKDKSVESMFLIMIVTFILPIIFFFITRGKFIAEWWIKKSIPLLLAYGSVLCIMIIAIPKKAYWGRFICPIKNTEIR